MSRLRNSKIEPTAPAPATSRRQVAAEQHPDATNPGDPGGEAIPVPIPNTEVKLSSAEDTERAAFRENRSSPGFLRVRGILRPRNSASREHPVAEAGRPSAGLPLDSAPRPAAPRSSPRGPLD